ncbi:peptide-methionine (S)-S-oxide reductase [Croceicoccus estronivorus]|uniref:peptide-methionine (S)-S-oxide reductase MsrA n=1 Tax=Croceicoccus estronivorus TaxID=1172626 RepID=UPI0008346B88|nr:peptide-methionine (S)-S-oxide reductase MsrA [Croceicoccus estronivorus]OCC23915.1 peptide-methionine (S)-S-oxide reductase [Croceicoccus estronivorus]
MRRAAALGALALFLSACQQPVQASEKPVEAPAPKRVADEGKGLQTAIFAGGCFWGVEGVFSHVKGVTSAISGYHGGNGKNADYAAVSGGRTGHAEAVKVTYNPEIVRYDQLLRIFFSVIADPTTLNYQGPDHGTQYRSALVPLDAEQRKVAAAYLAQIKASGVWHKPIVTRIEAYRAFYPAEAHHQDFMAAHPRHPYIVQWDAPKVKALKRIFPGMYRAGFVTG